MVKKTAAILASLIIILAIGGFLFVRNFDLNRYKGYIEDIVYQQTGRKLSLNGDAKIGLSLIPTLVVNDVTFANPEWAQNPYMAKLNKLEVQFSLGALMNKQINIKKLILIDPQVYLEVAKDGRKSWEFTNLGAEIKSKASGKVAPKVKDAKAVAVIGLVAKEVRLENGVVNYFDAKSGKNTLVLLNEAEFEADTDKPMKLSLDATYDKQDITAQMQFSDLQKIMQSNNVEFEGEVKAFNLKAVVNGILTDLTGDIKYTSELNLHNPAGNFDAPETSLSARVDGDINKADVNIRSLNIATNELTGDIKLNWSKAKPEVVAELRSDVFDMRALSKNSMLSYQLPGIIIEANALEIVPATAIPYDYLKMANGSANVKIGKLIFNDGLILLDIVANAKLNGGILDISKLDLTAMGGKINVNGNINAINQAINAKITADGIKVADLYKLARSDDNLQVLSGGLLDIDADIKANGATYRRLSETLSGSFTALVDKSRVKTGRLDWLTQGIWGELFKLLKIDTAKNTELDVECAVINSKLSGGKALFDKGIVFSSDKLKLVSTGEINLANDNIDFMVSPMMNKLAQGNISQAIASFIRLRGKLHKPSIGIDTTSAVSTVVGSVATGGIYLGSEMLMSGDANLCNTALKGSKYISRFPRKESMQNDVKDIYQGVTGNAKDAVREIGNTAKGIFKSFKNSLKNSTKGETN